MFLYPTTLGHSAASKTIAMLDSECFPSATSATAAGYCTCDRIGAIRFLTSALAREEIHLASQLRAWAGAEPTLLAAVNSNTGLTARQKTERLAGFVAAVGNEHNISVKLYRDFKRRYLGTEMDSQAGSSDGELGTKHDKEWKTGGACHDHRHPRPLMERVVEAYFAARDAEITAFVRQFRTALVEMKVEMTDQELRDQFRALRFEAGAVQARHLDVENERAKVYTERVVLLGDVAVDRNCGPGCAGCGRMGLKPMRGRSGRRGANNPNDDDPDKDELVDDSDKNEVRLQLLDFGCIFECPDFPSGEWDVTNAAQGRHHIACQCVGQLGQMMPQGQSTAAAIRQAKALEPPQATQAPMQTRPPRAQTPEEERRRQREHERRQLEQQRSYEDRRNEVLWEYYEERRYERICEGGDDDEYDDSD